MSPYVAISHKLLRAKTDATLVALVGEGSDAAFATIVERYSPALLRHCRSMLGSHQAEDAVQQTFVSALQSLRSGTEVRELRPWLYRIAHNVAIRELTGKHAGRLELDAEWEDVASSGELERRAEVRAVLGEVVALPGRQRVALIRSTSGESNAAIAADMGMNEAALRQLIYRARSTVRDKLRILFPGPLVWVGTRLEPLASRLPWASDGVTPLLAPAAAVIAGAALVVTPSMLGHHGQPHHRSAGARIEAVRSSSGQAVSGSASTPLVASHAPGSSSAATPAAPSSPAPLSGSGAKPSVPAGWVAPKIVSRASVNQRSGPGWVTPQYLGSGSSWSRGGSSGGGSSSSSSGGGSSGGGTSAGGSSSGSGYVTPQYYGSNSGSSGGGSSGSSGGGSGPVYTTPVIVERGGGSSSGASSGGDASGSGWVTPQYTGSGS